MPVDFSISNPPIEQLDCELLRRSGVALNVLRLDKCHPLVGGNKWYKLKHNLLEFQRQPELPILSFGGAYSNHLYALAAAGKLLGQSTIGIVRGELSEPLNPVLDFAKRQGMTLWPVSRGDYRRKQDADFLEELRSRFGSFHLLPEGGSNALAIQGCEEIAGLLQRETTASKRLVALCCGTGTTMAGLICGMDRACSSGNEEVLGVSVLKGDGYLKAEVEAQLRAVGCGNSIPWSVDDSHHCGGYARSNSELRGFLENFAGFSDLPLEPVYTGKLFYALFDLIEKGEIPSGTEVVAIHSGGVHS
jgi:1-aminocyclopropane-1-carboxylate deaminase/D-cysteine desulfhydrase-like pyridoxal-dependent ACC family enzyme